MNPTDLGCLEVDTCFLSEMSQQQCQCLVVPVAQLCLQQGQTDGWGLVNTLMSSSGWLWWFGDIHCHFQDQYGPTLPHEWFFPIHIRPRGRVRVRGVWGHNDKHKNRGENITSLADVLIWGNIGHTSMNMLKMNINADISISNKTLLCLTKLLPWH